VGSEGSLGFITEATIKLIAPPTGLKVLLLGLPNLDSIMNVYSEFKFGTKLCAYEMFSDKALAHVLKSTGLTNPLSANYPFYVVAEIESSNDQDEENILNVFEKNLEQGFVTDGAISQNETQAKQFWRLREDISESLSKHSPYKNDISVRISKVPDLIRELDPIFSKAYPSWEVVWFGHIGDGNLHINILRPEGLSKEDFTKECRVVDKIVFEAVQKFHGSISAEHGLGLTKKSFLNYSRSAPEISLMKQIKAAFDPDNIINPGKVLE
jgi:FAD/FMN-containing dehydrogenase